MNRNFWKDKKVFITGHTGFKGSWLSLWLQSCGAHLAGYALAPAKQNLFEDTHVDEGMESVAGDVRDLEQLRSTIEKHKPEVLFHLAAQSLVRYSYRYPVETFSTNLMGTVNVLEAARQSESVRVVVIITSDKCYDNKEWVWGYRENDPMGGFDPYSCSKGGAELITASYRNSFFPVNEYDQHGVGLASARAGNVIGGGDWSEDRLIPDIIKAFMERTPVSIRNPSAIRPWQHVLEPLSGYMHLAESLWDDGPRFSQAWNFGPNDKDAKSVGWIVKRLAALWGDGAQWVINTDHQPHEAHYLKLDCSKAKSLLGWSPRLSLDNALEWTTDYYRTYQQKGDMKQLIEKQISDYEAITIE